MLDFATTTTTTTGSGTSSIITRVNPVLPQKTLIMPQPRQQGILSPSLVVTCRYGLAKYAFCVGLDAV